MKTKKLYDRDAYTVDFEAAVFSCNRISLKDSNAEKLEKEEKADCVRKEEAERILYEVILDQTLFFPEEGGQTPDKGMLNGIEVLDVQIKDGVIVHTLAEPLREGGQVKGEINWQHRFFHMQQHSGEHIFSGLAYKRFGCHNVGFHLSDQSVTMDFDRVFTENELKEMEWAVNEAITANVEVKTGYPSKDELSELSYRSKIEIDGAVRIVEIPGYDICACCAPHVHRTGEIGMFKIQNVQNHRGGMRISFLCGFRALEEYRKKSQVISELMGLLTTNQETLAENVGKLKVQAQSLKTKLDIANQSLLEYKIETIPAEQKNVLFFERDIDTPVMRNIVNKLTSEREGICGIFVGDEETGYTFILGSKTSDCRKTAAKMREEFGARGGGSAAMIQGTVKKMRKEIEECLVRMEE